MFFSITQEPDARFPNGHQLDHAWFNCDNGWSRRDSADQGTIFFKGYCNTTPLAAVVNDFVCAGQHQGNYSVIQFASDDITVRHSRNRSFELWYNDSCVTNLPTQHVTKNVWASHELHISNDWQISLTLAATDQQPFTEKITINQAVDQIGQLLDLSVQEFFTHNNPDLKLYFSGGIDTLLLYSLLEYNQKPFTLVPYTFYEQDEFTTQNHDALNSFWNYRQIHHWNTPTWLATGSHGDEYFLRGPEIVAMLTAWHDINLLEIIKQYPDSYHYVYYLKNTEIWTGYWNQRHQLREQYPTEQLLHQQIINFLLNDYQYFHLGNTLTWTPYKNIDIVRILLQCSIDDLMPQFINADINRRLIARTDRSLLTALSKHKNHNSNENVMVLLKRNRKTL
jgi:hypothetical protein